MSETALRSLFGAWPTFPLDPVGIVLGVVRIARVDRGAKRRKLTSEREQTKEQTYRTAVLLELLVFRPHARQLFIGLV